MKSKTCDQKTDCAYASMASNEVCEIRLVMATALAPEVWTVKRFPDGPDKRQIDWVNNVPNMGLSALKPRGWT